MRRVLGGLFAWAVIPAVAALLLVAVAPDLGFTARIAIARGELGDFTAQQQICTHSRNGTKCSWSGRFVDAHGADRYPVYLEGNPRGWQPGTTASVIWLADRPTAVFRVHDPRPLLLVAGLTAVAVALLLMWGIAAGCRVTGRRTPRWLNRVHRFCGWPPVTPSS